MKAASVGKRCRVVSLARDNVTGVLLRGRTGTVRSQRENLDRTLFLVEWDGAAEANYLLSGDIELLDAERHPQGASL